MTAIPNNVFDQAVARFFEPFAQQSGFPLRKLQDGIYEILGQAFVMRIRRGVGHRKGILITLLPKQDLYYDHLENIHNELGLGNFVEFNNERLIESPIETTEDYILEAEKLAKVAEQYVIPYLLGAKTDFIEVKEYTEKRSAAAVREIKKYYIPRNVRKEWL